MGTVIADNFASPDGTTVVPVGTVIMYYGQTAPTGYLECNGQSTSGFPELEALIGANTPDLRGEFVRGWDNGRGVDTNRDLGSTQNDTTRRPRITSFSTNNPGDHTHTYRIRATRSGNSSGGTAFGDDSLTGNINSGGNGGHTHSIQSGGDPETRPRNVALMHCIKT